MQFVTNGPDIPEELLHAHEEGRVVFFCGAGISYPADLKNFSWLVDQIYLHLNEQRTDRLEKEAYDKDQYDTTLHLLENRLPGGRRGLAMRRALHKALKPNLKNKGATNTHLALLTLGLTRDSTLRLVTTNFDHLFIEAAKSIAYELHAHTAPLLPIPKKSSWDGLVYLHGLLPEKVSDAALNRLIVTSADFGLAYLTERWAARFVSELLRTYAVCFVGYGINDTVIRYIMDALAADRALGESTPKAWVFGACQPGDEKITTENWKAKGVTPILYSNSDGTHSLLHETFTRWAASYRDGVQGKEALVVQIAMAKPSASTKQDDFAGQMLWALSHVSGLPAKRFADFIPTPPLEWLFDCFSEKRFSQLDLARFGVPPKEKVSDELKFSLIHRPLPYDLASPMRLVSGGRQESQWDEVMHQLARWLVRHLDDPRLVIWIADHGGQLHDIWQRLIEAELYRFAELERKGKTTDLDEIRQKSPKAIPGPLLRTLWRILLSGRVKSPWHKPDLYLWKSRLNLEGLTTTLRLELREILAPKVVLKKPFQWDEDDSNSADESTPIKQLVEWEIVLAADHVHYALDDLADAHWTSALPFLLEDLEQLLRDALDLKRELGEANDRSDKSHWDLPSIQRHAQNRGFHDWVSLIELLRDAWLAVRVKDSARASRIAQRWFELPYPTFKRLALFAASQDDCIPPAEWVAWLLAEDAWWVWSISTKREVLRLFVQQGQHLAGATQERLEAAILAGPPQAALEQERQQARTIWLHLAKMKTSGVTMGAHAATRLAEISSNYPLWQLAANESDEFSVWMSGTDDPDYKEVRVFDIAPRKRKELVQWLIGPTPKQRPPDEDSWRDVCRTRFFHSLIALCDLAHDDKWPVDFWREALQVWSQEGMVLRSWRNAATLVQAMPDDVLLAVARGVTWWMEAVSKSINRHEHILLELCRRVLALPLETGAGSRINRNGNETYDPVGSAINHPIGHVTQALINLWFKNKPNDNDLIPPDLKPMFTKLCDVEADHFVHGRVLLGSRLIAFFRIDRPWTEQHLLPLFSWSNAVEAKAVWEGFFWSPRLYQPLLTAFKSQFLDCANHYAELGEHREQFAAFLTYAALCPTEGYKAEEFRLALIQLPPEGLAASARAFYQALASTEGQREEYWRNRAQPFWQKIWPKIDGLATPRIGEFLALMAIAARDEFPAALSEIKDWLKPLDHPHTVVHSLQTSGLCGKFPTSALALLNAVIDEKTWASTEVTKCLDQIVQAAPSLAHDALYLRLREYCRKRGAADG